MRTRHAMVIALAGMVAAACETRDDTAAEPGLLPGDEMTTEQPRDMMVARGEFQPTADAGALNISGWAELRQRGTGMDDGLELRVHLMGLGEGDHAWHIHSGTCESPGPIVLPLSDVGDHMAAGTTTTPARTDADHDTRDGIASDLNAGSDGMVEETVTIDRDRAAGLDWHTQGLIVNVHQRGGDNPGPAIACAPIQTTGAAGTQPYGTQPAQPGTGTGY
jgi:hypothetical protein